jgi:hypothetical protein
MQRGHEERAAQSLAPGQSGPHVSRVEVERHLVQSGLQSVPRSPNRTEAFHPWPAGGSLCASGQQERRPHLGTGLGAGHMVGPVTGVDVEGPTLGRHQHGPQGPRGHRQFDQRCPTGGGRGGHGRGRWGESRHPDQGGDGTQGQPSERAGRSPAVRIGCLVVGHVHSLAFVDIQSPTVRMGAQNRSLRSPASPGPMGHTAVDARLPGWCRNGDSAVTDRSPVERALRRATRLIPGSPSGADPLGPAT